VPARSSPRSNGRRTPRAARSSLTGKWWSGCTPIWPAAPLQSPTRLSTTNHRRIEQNERRLDEINLALAVRRPIDTFPCTSWRRSGRQRSVVGHGGVIVSFTPTRSNFAEDTAIFPGIFAWFVFLAHWSLRRPVWTGSMICRTVAEQ
jgi:hypothetical protein